MKTSDVDRFIARDVRRAFIVTAFVNAWGLPSSHSFLASPDGKKIAEAFSFSSRGILRTVSVGISLSGEPERSVELILVTRAPSCELSCPEKEGLIYDLAVELMSPEYSHEVPGLENVERLKAWGFEAVLLDEARGEPDTVSRIHVPNGSVDLIWVVPLLKNEVEIIRHDGMRQWDLLVETGEIDVTDLGRAKVC
jgi:hypothetical protein